MFVTPCLAVLIVTLALGSSVAIAADPSAKAAVLVGDALAPATCGVGLGWAPIFQVRLRNSGSQKDFVMGLSGVIALLTDTTVKSAGGTSDKSEAEAIVRVRMLVDGAVALPGPITFARRKQTLIAKFNGICVDANGDGIVQFSECTTPEELQLILETQAAQHFNFVATNVGTGVHTVRAEACTATATSAQTGSANASAAYGKGTLYVQEGRLIRGAVVEQ